MSQRALLPLLLALIASKLALNHLSDPDLFWHLRLGLDMLQSGALPDSVAYSTPLAGQPYLPNDWLAEIVLAGTFRAGGFMLLMLGKILLCAGLVLLLYTLARLRNGDHAMAAALATFLASLVATSNFTLRPVLLGMLCFGAVLFTCEQLARGRRLWLVVLPLLFCVWINVHGSWLVGIGAVAAFSGGILIPLRLGRLGPREAPPQARSAAMMALPLALAGLFVNPCGLSFLRRPLRLLVHHREIAVFKEWGPVPLHDPSAWIFAAAALALILALGISRRRITHTELAFVVATAAMASRTALYQIVFAIAMLPLLSEHLASRLPSDGLANRLMNAVVLAGSGLVLLTQSALSLLTWRSEVRTAEPIDVVATLERLPQARLPGFNYFDWGGYLVFRGIPTYIDGRLEPFIDSGLFAHYLDIEREGDVAALRSEGLAWALVRKGTVLSAHLAASPDWHRATGSVVAELYLRDTPADGMGAANDVVPLAPPRALCQPWCEGLGGP